MKRHSNGNSADKCEFFCNLSGKKMPLPHFWEHTVGSGHATLALRADWQRQLRQCHEELGFRHVRFHGILCDDVGTLVEEQGKRLYSFFNLDQIFDFLLSIGMKPFVELSFMPKALASGKTTVFHYHANVTPPAEYDHWDELIDKLAAHLVQRYGASGLRDWFFEVWNEPNMKSFWTGTQEEYFKLCRHTAKALKAVDNSLKVGGPVTAKNEWIEEFLDFCQKNSLPLDFISTHQYPTDAFGSAGDDTAKQLAESKRSILREEAQNTFRKARGKPVYYTEWNSSSNPKNAMHDEPYAAAFLTKSIMEANGLMEAYSLWTFTDIFEENYFASQPFHGGFGLLNIYGVPKPSYRAFQLLHGLGTSQLLVDGLPETVDAWVVPKKDSVTVLLTNYARPRHPIEAQRVAVTLAGAPKPHAAHVERIDETHANAAEAWRHMDSPQYLSADDVDRLQLASQMKKEPHSCRYDNDAIHFEIVLPPQSVAAVTIELRPGK